MAATAPTRRPASVRRPPAVLLAVAGALSVANTYYAQPLLDAISRQLQVGAGTAGLVVTFGPVGIGQVVPALLGTSPGAAATRPRPR